jgi:hypothetical protein
MVRKALFTDNVENAVLPVMNAQSEPATNSFAVIWRRALDNKSLGESAEIQAAWIRLPAFVIIPSRQRYDRLSESTYRYTSLASGFHAEIETDKCGFPVRYGNIWERVG